MSEFWSPIVHQLKPYVPGEQPKVEDLIKLNTNENPYGPSPKVKEAIQAAVTDSLRLYPDPNSEQLKGVIADYYGVNEKQVFVGNGSDEVLGHVFQAFFQKDKPLLFPDITYSFYPVYSQLYGVEIQRVALDLEFSIRVEDYQMDCGGVIIPNPNAPTGKYLELDQIERLLKAQPHSVVVIDEAYIDFGGASAVRLVDHYPNLLVIQTLSKSRSLAGLRLGYAIGQPDLIAGLDRVKNSFNSYPIDRLAEVGAIAAFEDETYFQDTCQTIISTRENLVRELNKLNFNVVPSAANFVFVSHANMPAEEIFSKLREKNILVRHWAEPRISNYLRISVGTEEESERLLTVLNKILNRS